jgi:hypothetical protein
MTPGVLNRICAHPKIVSWVLGACALNAVVLTGFLSNEARRSAVAADWRVMVWLLLAMIPASLLGYFLGMFTCWPWVRPVCSRLNGSPLRGGDRVLILSGPQKGAIADVYEISVGQGGWDLARLDLGPERKACCTDIFEEYSLLKIERGEPDGTADGSQPIRSETNRTSSAAGSSR